MNCSYYPEEEVEYRSLFPKDIESNKRLPLRTQGPNVLIYTNVGRTAYLEEWAERYPNEEAPSLPPAAPAEEAPVKIRKVYVDGVLQ